MKNSYKSFIPLAVLAGSCIGYAQETSTEEDLFELSPFVVQTTEADRYREDQSASGSIIAMDMMDIPMDVTVIGENMIEEMAIYNADEIGQIISAVSSNESVNSSGGGGNTVYTLRGFRSVPRRNGFAPGGRLYDMTSVGRIEVIKGPNSVLYGQTDPGGIINYIPKRPLFKQMTDLSFSYGSYSRYRVSADVTGPIGSGNNLAYRVPMSWSSYESDVDFYKNDRSVIAPSVLWRLGKKTELFVETEFLQQEVNLADDAAWVKLDAEGKPVTDYDKGGLGRSFNELGPNTYSTNDQYNVTASLTTTIGDNLHIRAQAAYNVRETYIQKTDPGGNNARRVLMGSTIPDWRKAYPVFVSYPENLVKGVKIDALYEKTFGGITTKTLFGFERNFNEFEVTRYNAKLTQPALPRVAEGEAISESDWDWVVGHPTENPGDWQLVNGHPTWNSAIWHNYRISETIHMLDDRLVFLGGLARGDVRRLVKDVQTNPTERETTYMGGVTYKATQGVVLFANTSTSFAPVYQTGLDAEPLDPASGVGFEAGLKFDLFDNNLFATVTYFDLTNEGLPRQVPASESPTGESYWINSGEENAKGVELQLQWNVTSQLELYVSMLKFDGQLVTASAASSSGVPGQDIPRSPETAGQITLKYVFARDSNLDGLRVGITGAYKDSAPIVANYTNPTIVSDAYFILNGFIRYKLPTELDTELFMNFKNLLNEKYIMENNLYGDLRQLSAGVQVKF